MQVRVYKDWSGLVSGLRALASQPLSVSDAVIVQEWISFDIEFRLFFIEPQAPLLPHYCPSVLSGCGAQLMVDGKLVPVAASQILYTAFERIDHESKLRDFRRLQR